MKWYYIPFLYKRLHSVILMQSQVPSDCITKNAFLMWRVMYGCVSTCTWYVSCAYIRVYACVLYFCAKYVKAERTKAPTPLWKIGPPWKRYKIRAHYSKRNNGVNRRFQYICLNFLLLPLFLPLVYFSHCP